MTSRQEGAARLRKDGLSVGQIGARMGVSKQRASQLLKSAGVDMGERVDARRRKARLAAAAAARASRRAASEARRRAEREAEAGKAYGRLRVLAVLGDRGLGDKGSRFRCLCDPALGGCGKEHLALACNVIAGRTRSCGCAVHLPRSPRRARAMTLLREGATVAAAARAVGLGYHAVWRACRLAAGAAPPPANVGGRA